MAVAARNGVPIAATIASGQRHQTQLVAQTLRACFASSPPTLLIGDKAYDSDALDHVLLASGVELVAPHSGRKTKLKTEGGFGVIEPDGTSSAALHGSNDSDDW